MMDFQAAHPELFPSAGASQPIPQQPYGFTGSPVQLSPVIAGQLGLTQRGNQWINSQGQVAGTV